MNEILKNGHQIEEAAKWLDDNKLLRHQCHQKNWDLAHVLPRLSHGNILDMGAYTSWVLANAKHMGLQGEKCGIDLNPLPASDSDYHLKQGDLCDTGYPDHHFRYITCLSVIEHGVDFEKFMAESSRILEPGGLLMVTFDYWPTKYNNLPSDWNLLTREEGERLISVGKKHGFFLDGPMDWEHGNPVLMAEWTWPHVKNVGYTFGYMAFVGHEAKR